MDMAFNILEYGNRLLITLELDDFFFGKLANNENDSV